MAEANDDSDVDMVRAESASLDTGNDTAANVNAAANVSAAARVDASRVNAAARGSAVAANVDAATLTQRTNDNTSAAANVNAAANFNAAANANSAANVNAPARVNTVVLVSPVEVLADRRALNPWLVQVDKHGNNRTTGGLQLPPAWNPYKTLSDDLKLDIHPGFPDAVFGFICVQPQMGMGVTPILLNLHLRGAWMGFEVRMVRQD